MSPFTGNTSINVHLIETNPNVPLRPALDYNALGSTQPNLHDVSTQFPHAILLKFKDPPCLRAPSASCTWDGKPKLFFACGQIRTVIINRNISQYRKSHNAVNRYSNDNIKKKEICSVSLFLSFLICCWDWSMFECKHICLYNLLRDPFFFWMPLFMLDSWKALETGTDWLSKDTKAAFY